MLYVLYTAPIALTVFAALILLRVKKVYREKKPLSLALSIGWWILDTAWTGMVALSSIHSVWPLPLEEKGSLAGGAVLLASGTLLTLAGAAEFHSVRRVSGMEVSKLITTGIYGWSRNPQFLGFYLALLGISLMGRSGYAVLLTAVAVIYCHYYIVRVEEPYLEHLFGKEYVKYKLKTPRYVGMPRRESSG